MRMNLSNEKFAYSIVSRNLKDYFKKKFDPKEFEFLVNKEGLKKGPVSYMLDVFKYDFDEEVKNNTFIPKKNYLKKKQNVWKNKQGQDVHKTKAKLDGIQRQK